MNMDDFKKEEKRIHEEYKKKLAELKKIKNKQNPSSQVFTKGLLPIYVLHILNQGPSNGNDISNKIGECTNGLWLPSTGGIYPLLKKLEETDYIIGTWDNPDKRFQKIYSLTKNGLEEYHLRRKLLKPKIEEALTVFKIIYKDLYK